MQNYTIESEKIVITTNFPREHLDEFIQCTSDPDLGFNLMNHGFHYPYTEEDAVEFIERNREAGNEIFAMDFFIFHENHFAGIIGLSDIDYDNSRSHVGYWTGKSFRNRGIAGEALGLVIEFARKTLKLHSLYTSVLTENIPSISVLTKNGFSLDGIQKDYFEYDRKFYSAFAFSLVL